MLAAQLQAARLDSLRSQLHPHFLFNALHAINGLILQGQTDVALRSLSALGTLLRRSFRHTDHAMVTVEEEVGLIQEYLALESIRLGKRLQTRINISSEAEQDSIPPLILLPIVENAIRYGIAPNVDGGLVAVEVARNQQELSLTIQDSGNGVDIRENNSGTGIGLQNCRERLTALYGKAGQLSIERQPESTSVTIRLPLGNRFDRGRISRMNVLIVDDEPIAREVLHTFLQQDSGVSLIEECESGDVAREKILGGTIDIVFLDIEMPRMNGFEVLKDLPENQRPVVVFVTAYEEHALRAIEIGAIDYLLKPFDQERFRSGFSRAKERCQQRKLASRTQALITLFHELKPDELGSPSSRLTVQDGPHVRWIKPHQILWIEADDKYIVIHTEQGSLRTRRTLGEVVKQLDEREFMRIHRSCLVALSRVSQLGYSETGAPYVMMENGTRLAVSRSKLSSIRSRLG